jgi:CHAT domain-containing protein
VVAHTRQCPGVCFVIRCREVFAVKEQISMSHRPIGLPFNKRAAAIAFALVLRLIALTAAGQTQPPTDVRELPPGLSVEREMSGAETHQYKFDLKAQEFFQVSVEQRELDVSLSLRDAGGKVLATMDSPNGTQGSETLSFVAESAGEFLLEVGARDPKAAKGGYTIRREASRTATATDRRRVEVERLFVEGMGAMNSDRETSLKKLKEARAGWKELADAKMEEFTSQFADFQAMNVVLNEGHALLSKAQQMHNEGKDKSNIEAIHAAAKVAAEADVKFRETGVLAGKILSDYPDFVAKHSTLTAYPYLSKAGQVNVAGFLAMYFQYLLEPKEQLKYARLAASLAREARNVRTPVLNEDDKLITEVAALYNVASALKEGNNPEALDYYEQTLSSYRELKKLGSPLYNPKQEATFLVTLTGSYFDPSLCRPDFRGCLRKTIEYAKQAAQMYESLKDEKELVRLYLLTSAAHLRLGEIYDSFGYADKALSLAQSIGDKELISEALFAKASLFAWLGNKEKAHELLKQELDVSLAIPSYTSGIEAASMPPFERRNRLRQEYVRLNGLASIYSQTGEPLKAIEFYRQAISVARLLEDKSIEARSLGSIGEDYKRLKDWSNALNYYQQSLALFRETGDRESEALTLTDAALCQLELKKPEESLRLLTQDRQLYSSLGIDESGVDNISAKTWYALGNRRVAIFYGRKLINWIQGQRQKLSAFDSATLQGFVNTFEAPIRRQADWLIEAGRFDEAEQVLSMLKEEEYSSFVRRDPDEIKGLSLRLRLEPEDKKVIERYGQLTTRVSQIGEEYYRLDEKQRQLGRKKLRLTDEEQKRYEALGGQLKDANAAFALFLNKELVSELGQQKKREIDVDRSLQDKLRKWSEGTVTLYTVVGENRYRVILTTPAAQVDGKYEISAAKLNKKIFDFRAALQNPRIDPRPLGRELYDILIGPIEKDLQAVHAKTLVWSLDGTLRYLPLAALSPDGNSYMVNKYQNVIITPQTLKELANPSEDWRALGVGVSQSESVTDPDNPEEKINFKGLPGTKSELLSIVKDEDSQGESGVLPGKRFLDEGFTARNFTDSLKEETEDGQRKYTVIHIASHFRLGSNWTNSFLLMGNGQILSLQEINSSPDISFGDVELITLSACNTAFADQANGKEVDSLAEAIQTKGARAVMATLWSVADASSSLLMSEFYRLKKENPRLTKAAALQLAQQEMLAGKLVPPGAAGARRDTGEADAAAPPDYSHPYYWSPFVLIGNWR